MWGRASARNALRFFESLCAQMLNRTGLDLAYRETRRHRVPVLMYHSVTAPDAPKDSCLNLAGMSVSASTFREHMAFVSQFYTTITLADYVKWRKGQGTIPGNACVVTFDDGFNDTYQYAVPVLQRHKQTATFFVIGKVLSSRKAPWPHDLYDLLDHHALTDCADCLISAEPSLSHEKEPPWETKAELVGWIRRHAKGLDPKQREELVRAMRECLGGEGGGCRGFMTPEQVLDLSRSGFEIGCHSQRHEYMTSLTPRELEEDIRISKSVVSETAAANVESFCYPFGGVGSWSDLTCRTLKAQGFQCACTTLEGLNGGSRDLFQLRRVRIEGNVPVPVLGFRMLGLRSWAWDSWLLISKLRRAAR